MRFGDWEKRRIQQAEADRVIASWTPEVMRERRDGRRSRDSLLDTYLRGDELLTKEGIDGRARWVCPYLRKMLFPFLLKAEFDARDDSWMAGAPVRYDPASWRRPDGRMMEVDLAQAVEWAYEDMECQLVDELESFDPCTDSEFTDWSWRCREYLRMPGGVWLVREAADLVPVSTLMEEPPTVLEGKALESFETRRLPPVDLTHGQSARAKEQVSDAFAEFDALLRKIEEDDRRKAAEELEANSAVVRSDSVAEQLVAPPAGPALEVGGSKKPEVQAASIVNTLGCIGETDDGPPRRPSNKPSKKLNDEARIEIAIRNGASSLQAIKTATGLKTHPVRKSSAYKAFQAEKRSSPTPQGVAFEPGVHDPSASGRSSESPSASIESLETDALLDRLVRESPPATRQAWDRLDPTRRSAARTWLEGIQEREERIDPEGFDVLVHALKDQALDQLETETPAPRRVKV